MSACLLRRFHEQRRKGVFHHTAKANQKIFAWSRIGENSYRELVGDSLLCNLVAASVAPVVFYV